MPRSPQSEAPVSARPALDEACKQLILGGRMASATFRDLERKAAVGPGEVRRHFATRGALLDEALASLKSDLLQAHQGQLERATPFPSASRSSSSQTSAAKPAAVAALQRTSARTRRQVDDERRLRTRRALLEAAKRLIGNGRIDGASIDTIVREAGVGKGSFFNHFASREALVHTVLAAVRVELDDAIATRCEGVTDPVARLSLGLLVALRYRIEHGLGPRAILPIEPGMVDADAPANASLRKDLQAALDAGVLRIASLEAGLAVVLGVSELGLARLLDSPSDAAFAHGLMHSLCVTMLAALGVDARRHDRLARDALHAVIDVPLPA